MKALLLEHFQPKKAASGLPVAASVATEVSPPATEAVAPVLPTPAVVAAPRKEFKTRVLETIEEMGKPFRMRDLESRLRGWGQRSTLRSALMRLVQDGEVIILQKDRGRTGSLYQRKPPPAPAAGETAVPAAEAAGTFAAP